jgi:hypothetical protein
MAQRETMTSRERLRKALNHQEPDRVPIDLGGNQTGIHKFAYQKLIAHLGIQDEVRIMDAVQQLEMGTDGANFSEMGTDGNAEMGTDGANFSGGNGD